MPPVQALADTVEVDLLHNQWHQRRRRVAEPRQHGTDVDAIVRPDHVPSMMAALAVGGGELLMTFATGSPFGHAADPFHASLGTRPCTPALAWHGRSPPRVPGALVPALDHPPGPLPLRGARPVAQSLILLHAARTGSPGS